MKVKSLILLAGVLLSVRGAFAQEEMQRIEVFGEYSYLRFNPTIPQFHNRSFSGGGGGATFNITSHLGIKAELLGYGSTTWSATFSGPVVTPHGTIPAGTYSTQGNMFTYLFGPVVKVPFSRWTPFAELLFGGSNSNGYGNVTKAIDAGGGAFSTSGTQHPFTMALGGGLDVHLSHHFSLRPVELDYILTRYTNPFTNTNNQNSFRYTAGVAYRF
jgi:hypothetical protein